MSSEREIKPSRLPTFNDMPFTDIYKGKLTPEAYLFLSQSFKRLREVVDQFIDGIRVPGKTKQEIVDLGSNDLVPNGTIWFNTTDSQLNVKVGAGSIEVISTTPLPP